MLQYFWRCLFISKLEHAINEEIKDKEVRLVDFDGTQLGIVSRSEALNKAATRELDLVKIAPKAKPPVCKIMDYGKHCFEQAKRDKLARKSQKIIKVKEIKLSLNIDIHDFNTKVNHAKRFINDGDKIKVSIRFRGREMGHSDLGYETMQRFAKVCEEFAAVEKPAKMEGRSMLMFLIPKKN